MDNFDSAYAGAFQHSAAPDLVSYFSQGFNMANAMPFSPENVRKRQIEDYQLALKQQAIQTQAARYQQQMALRQQLLPFQIARLQHLSQGKNPTDPTAYANTLANIDQFTSGQHPPITIPDAPLPTQQDAANLPSSTSDLLPPQNPNSVAPDGPAL